MGPSSHTTTWQDPSTPPPGMVVRHFPISLSFVPAVAVVQGVCQSQWHMGVAIWKWYKDCMDPLPCHQCTTIPSHSGALCSELQHLCFACSVLQKVDAPGLEARTINSCDNAFWGRKFCHDMISAIGLPKKFDVGVPGMLLELLWLWDLPLLADALSLLRPHSLHVCIYPLTWAANECTEMHDGVCLLYHHCSLWQREKLPRWCGCENVDHKCG